MGNGKRNRAEDAARRKAEQAEWDLEELAVETVYAEWLRTGTQADLENLLQWDQMVSMVPPHIQISERHQAFLPQLRAVARGAERAERDG